MKFCNDLREKIKSYCERLSSEKMINQEDFICLELAIDCILKCRRTLKYTYIFGFYMKTNAKQKPLFEHGQFLLEQNTEKLQALMEKDYLKNTLSIESFTKFREEWTSFRLKVVNSLTATAKYLENLTNEIDLKMDDEIDYTQIK